MPDDNFFKRPTIPPLPHDESSAEPLPPIPEKIGPYPVETLLEKGGMSLLYLASDPETQAPLTIKVLSPRYLSHPEMTARFLKEAEIIALADHPNIVKLYGYGEWEGGLYIAMEFIQGVSLRQYLLQNPLSLRKALEMVLEIAYALCHLHTHGVIHRDLKPENVLVNDSGHIKVIDFGIAQLINPLEIERIQEENKGRRLVGTPVYMSPEQRKNPENVSYPSDIYSLGIIAYELVTGKLSQGQIHLSLVPKGLQKILTKTLQPHPEERYLDIVDFIADLSSYLHSPQFEKEKKVGDQAGEIFEKLQSLQQELVPALTGSLKEFDLGLVIHRPLGFSAVFASLIQKPPMLFLGESSASLDMEGLIQLLYLKGSLDILIPLELPLPLLAEKLNVALLNAPLKIPLSFAILQWDPNAQLLHFLSCGYGPLWKIHAHSDIESIQSPNMPLGLVSEIPFVVAEIPLAPGDRVITCPLSSTGTPFSADQFKALLTEFSPLPPQPLAEALYRKAKSQQIRYFDDHPFVVAILQFIAPH